MSVKIQQDSYNKRLDDRLQALQSKINSQVNTANVFVFNTNNLPTDSTYVWDNDAMLNGIRVANIKEMINYLKLNKVELKYISDTFRVVSKDSEYTIEIPDNYDGRNAFVLSSFNYATGTTWSDMYRFNVDASDRANSMMQSLNGTTGYRQMYDIVQNKSSIKILAKNMDVTSLDSTRYTKINVLVLLWRLK
jgi:hypothetical protein